MLQRTRFIFFCSKLSTIPIMREVNSQTWGSSGNPALSDEDDKLTNLCYQPMGNSLPTMELGLFLSFSPLFATPPAIRQYTLAPMSGQMAHSRAAARS